MTATGHQIVGMNKTKIEIKIKIQIKMQIAIKLWIRM